MPWRLRRPMTRYSFTKGFNVTPLSVLSSLRILEFPEFLENTVVPERKFLERWDPHRE